ncbi:Phosphoribosyltransferase [Azospirillaceae bacterium]
MGVLWSLRGVRIIVYSLEDARVALRAAAAAEASALHLVSPPGAACYSGVAWFLALISAAIRDISPPPVFSAFLDCGDQPGVVLNALRVGARALIFTGPCRQAERLVAVAVARNARILTATGPTLDLRGRRDAAVFCRRQLEKLERSRDEFLVVEGS